MSKLTHFNEQGAAHMVDVADKDITHRRAIAQGRISMQPSTLQLISEGGHKKGDVLGIARLAGIMAAKKTSDLIPLCHPLLLTHVDVEAESGPNGVRFKATVSCSGSTGVEMEALTAASVAALTLYDMVKAVEKGTTIEKVRLLEKSGGKSGLYKRRV